MALKSECDLAEAPHHSEVVLADLFCLPPQLPHLWWWNIPLVTLSGGEDQSAQPGRAPRACQDGPIHCLVSDVRCRTMRSVHAPREQDSRPALAQGIEGSWPDWTVAGIVHRNSACLSDNGPKQMRFHQIARAVDVASSQLVAIGTADHIRQDSHGARSVHVGIEALP